MYYGKTANGRNIKRWRLSDKREDILFKASHVNHPCNVWVRESKSNYRLMYKIYMACLSEYTYRYGKIHGSTRPSICLLKPPNNIKDIGLTELPQAMPEECKVPGDPIQGYKNYYINYKNNYMIIGGNIIGGTARHGTMWHGAAWGGICLLYTSPSPRDLSTSRMPSSA